MYLKTYIINLKVIPFNNPTFYCKKRLSKEIDTNGSFVTDDHDRQYKLGRIYLNEGFSKCLPIHNQNERLEGDYFDFSNDPAIECFNKGYDCIRLAACNGNLNAKIHIIRLNEDLNRCNQIYGDWLDTSTHFNK